jgi:hypothetical protein
MSNVATHIGRMIASLTLGALLATSASAALRSPQVTVNGTALQTYLNSKGESINVNTDQDAAQTLATTTSDNSTFTLQIEMGGNAGTDTYGIYNGSLASPPLYQMFPGAATNGWFAVASFRSAPTRVTINLFDSNATFVGSTTYLGADASDFGFYIQQNPGLVLYSQDARNPGGAAQMLVYAGNGANAGSWWLAVEDQTASQGADYNFDDAVLFLESINPTPVQATTWGAVKARFR